MYTGKLFMVGNDIPEVANTFEGSMFLLGVALYFFMRSKIHENQRYQRLYVMWLKLV